MRDEPRSRIDRRPALCYDTHAMARADYHTHTPLCLHAQGSPEDFVQQALRLGLADYGISDHMPMPQDETHAFDDWRMRSAQLPEYLEWVDRARRCAAGTGLRVLAALECDWFAGIEPWIGELRARAPWDYLIGSVHYLGSLGSVDDSVYAQTTTSGSVESDWSLYRSAILELVQSGLFDMLGHMDLVKIWGRRPAAELTVFWEPVLEALQVSGMVVELNTAGWHKPCAVPYPDEAVLCELLRRCIPIAINSDAHAPGVLSRDFERGLALLRRLAPKGLREYTYPCPVTSTPLHVYGSL